MSLYGKGEDHRLDAGKLVGQVRSCNEGYAVLPAVDFVL